MALTGSELLADLAAAGLSASAHGDRLRIAPVSKLTNELRERISDNKRELLELLNKPELRSSNTNGSGTDTTADNATPFIEDARTSCRACVFGIGSRCPDAAPLPFEVLHHCHHFRAAATPHMPQQGEQLPGEPMAQRRATRAFWSQAPVPIATTHHDHDREHDQ